MPTTVATGIRRPRMQGMPPIWSSLTVILTNVMVTSLVKGSPLFFLFHPVQW